MSSRIIVTGMGVVSALGWTPTAIWQAMEAGSSGLGPLTLFASPRCGHFPVGQVQGDPAQSSGLSRGSRSDHLAAYAARMAFWDAGLDKVPATIRKSIGLVLGGTTGGMLDTESFFLRVVREGFVEGSLLRHHECCHPANATAELLGLNGFRATQSTACSSGLMAIATACDVLKAGEAEIMLAGGVDSLTRLTLNGFASLLIIALDGCRPFDARRTGMSLGEGAAVLVLEREETALARKAPMLAEIGGFAHTCEAHHPTAPTPDGAGIYQAMALALQRAGLTPADVDYVNAHGTGTIDNDLAEGRALSRLFGEEPPPISSTKRFFGHTLGAAGAIETVVCILAMQNQRVPGTLGLLHPDPKIPIKPLLAPVSATVKTALNNSLGFGGACSSLVIGQVGFGRNGAVKDDRP